MLTWFCVGAPEYPGRSEHPVSQAIDIWSLACVFSLAATWIVCDYSGLSLFQKVRERAIAKSRQTQSNQTPPEQQKIDISESDQFHNGTEVLEAVTEWHKYLRIVMRKTDNITSRVLDLVDESMLLASPDERINASDLCSRLNLVLESCPQSDGPQLPEYIMTLLGEVDEDEACQAARTRRSRHAALGYPSSNKTITQNVRRPTLRIEPRLVTTHRQSIWPDQSLRLQDGKYPEMQVLGTHKKANTIAEQPLPSNGVQQTPVTPSRHHKQTSVSSMARPSTRSRRPGAAKRHPSQNYFQAYDALEKRGLLGKWLRKGSTPDGLLTSYFGGTRDIVSDYGHESLEPC